MLGNQADLFMTTPMPTSIVTQGNAGGAEMPAPRPVSRVSSQSFLPDMGNYEGGFLPDMGDGTDFEMLPGMGQFNLRTAMPWLIAGGVAWWLFMRKRPTSKKARFKR